jgi:hypothetical protein
MSDLRIQVGRTDGFRYIGVQPPLTDEQLERLSHAHEADEWVANNFTLRQPYQGQPYSEAGFMTEWDDRILEKAKNVARVLRETGLDIHLDEDIKQIGWGYHFFGGRDREAAK